jgi:hypothetical protein
MSKENISLYRKMKKILQERGWTSGDLIDNATGRCCILGAYGLANGIAPDDLAVWGGSKVSEVYNSAEEDERLETLVECANEVYKNKVNKIYDGDEIVNGADLYNLNDRAGEDAVYDALDCAIDKESSKQ